MKVQLEKRWLESAKPIGPGS